MARGLDVPECDVVVNLELPSSAVHYAHRAGRTGRMGRCAFEPAATSGPGAPAARLLHCWLYPLQAASKVQCDGAL